ncbi:hypothetical protein HZP44_10535 [Elizabethkingia anophelis]|uniref:hypothetical protein n=1 Tax=Elizabethkingia anophelis TaxID=1117645 RepID=UPI0021A8D9B9|nr:hypothetical protein [Elizabethkingia anophelis]MCT4205287.1 hypothetical protein [Elizabethkingia anophelis]MCT4208801.1 hypothetical protein [Elizabethkingia anophelis]
MTKKSKQTPRSSPLSKEPYKRREESEIIRILTEIDKGLISKLGACKKYGLNRNTLRLWITKLSIRTLEGKIPNTFFTEMDENSKNKALEKRIHELSKSLEYAKLKIAGLETMIKVAEEDLKIKIGKKSGTKPPKD